MSIERIEKTLETILLNTTLLKNNDAIIWEHLQPAIADIGNIADIVHQLLKENKELKAQLANIQTAIQRLS